VSLYTYNVFQKREEEEEFDKAPTDEHGNPIKPMSRESTGN